MVPGLLLPEERRCDFQRSQIARVHISVPQKSSTKALDFSVNNLLVKFGF